MKQPWWLLTNLSIPRKKLLERYARRWEIESTCKDMKHVQDLKGIRRLFEKLGPLSVEPEPPPG